MLHALGRSIRESFRNNAIPGLVLQVVALTIVLIYYFVPASHPAYDWVAGLKTRGGYLYSAIATGFFGGFVPFMYLAFTGRIPRREWLRHGAFLVLFWAGQGMVVDTLYTFQARWFGTDPGFRTIFKKVLVDQIPYNLLWATPSTILLYGWKDCGFSVSRLLRSLSGRKLLFSYVSIQVNAWFVWVPAVAIIYSLPVPLQVPLFNLVVCFFTLLLAVVTRPSARER